MLVEVPVAEGVGVLVALAGFEGTFVGLGVADGELGAGYVGQVIGILLGCIVAVGVSRKL